MFSFSYNGIDLADYGVLITKTDLNSMRHDFDSVQMEDKAYSWKSRLQPLVLSLDILVSASFYVFPPLKFADIHHQVSFIREILNQREDSQLILSNLSERYWMARFKSLSGDIIAPGHFKGSIDFLCPDPRAFSVEETSHQYNIDANPKAISESLVGTAYVEPVYLLTAGENIPAATVILENQTTGESIQWTGNLSMWDEIEIDVAHWTIKKNGMESMDTVTGKFPRLIPVSNNLVVSGFGTTGLLQITYRNAYV